MNRKLFIEVTDEEYRLIKKGALDLTKRSSEDLINEIIRRTPSGALKKYHTGTDDPLTFEPNTAVRGVISYGNAEQFTYSCIVDAVTERVKEYDAD